MLCTSNDTSVLDALDRLGHTNTGQNWVRRETLPVAASSRGTANWACNRAQLDVDALAPVLFAHGQASLVHEIAVKSGCCREACGEGRGPVRKSNTQGRVLQAQVLVKAKTGYRTDVANADFALPATLQSALWMFFGKKNTYPTPVVMLTFSRSVICETNSLAWA